jgi:hypothetical protein
VILLSSPSERHLLYILLDADARSVDANVGVSQNKFDFMNTCLGNMTGKPFPLNDPDVSNGECLLQSVIPSSLTLTNDLLLGDTFPFLDQDCL